MECRITHNAFLHGSCANLELRLDQCYELGGRLEEPGCGRQNGLEGRDPRVVGDELACGAVAAWLGIEVHALAKALLELQQSGLIELSPPDGVRLSDLARLEHLVDELPLARAWVLA